METVFVKYAWQIAEQRECRWRVGVSGFYNCSSCWRKRRLMKSNLKEYQSATQNRKSCIPGSANNKKNLQFINAHLRNWWALYGVLVWWLLYPAWSLNIVPFVLTKDGQVLCPWNVFPSLCQILKIPPILNRSMRHQLPQKRETSSARSFSTKCEHKENV